MTRPPLADGISWWGRRWAEALSIPEREPRGRGRLRIRSVKLRELDRRSGEATVEVTTSSIVPYEVRIQVAPFPEPVWRAAMAGAKSGASTAARLLAGDLPEEVEGAFRAAGGSLFPGPVDVRARCSCAAAFGGCRHLPLAHRALAEAIGHDPFLLFDLRGHPRGEVLAALGVAPRESAVEAAAPGDPPTGVPEALFRRPTGDLAAAHFHIAAPERSLLILTRLGDPPGWKGPPSLLEKLGPIVQAAAAKARAIARGESEGPREG